MASSRRHWLDESEIGLAERPKLRSGQVASGVREPLDFVDKTVKPLELACAVDHRMRGKNLLDQRRSHRGMPTTKTGRFERAPMFAFTLSSVGEKTLAMLAVRRSSAAAS